MNIIGTGIDYSSRPVLLKGGNSAFAGDQSDTDKDEEIDDSEGAGENILCSACNSVITTTKQKINVAGKHNHVQTNPEGIVFNIGCFGSAPGCTQVGEQLSYWSWFEGYNWQVSVCRACGWHLGWLFRSGNKSFFGLILGRLIEEKD